MALRVVIPEGRREAFRDAMIRLLPFLTCDVCSLELDEHTWFEVKAPGTNAARIVRCSESEGEPCPPTTNRPPAS